MVGRAETNDVEVVEHTVALRVEHHEELAWDRLQEQRVGHTGRREAGVCVVSIMDSLRGTACSSNGWGTQGEGMQVSVS